MSWAGSSWGGGQKGAAGFGNFKGAAGSKGGPQQWGGNTQGFGGKGTSFAAGGKGSFQKGHGKVATPPPAVASGSAKGYPAKGAGKSSAKGSPGVPGAKGGKQVDKGGDVLAQVAKLTQDVGATEKTAKAALESSLALLKKEDASPVAVQTSVTSLEKQQAKLTELQTRGTTLSTEARKVGQADSVQAITKLTTDVRSLVYQLAQGVVTLKGKHVQATVHAEMKAKASKELAAFKSLFAKAKNECTAADNAANAVAKLAAPIVANPPEGEDLDKKADEVEKAADGAIKKLESANKQLAEQIKTVNGYSPEARKTAHADLMALQKKVVDAIRAVANYKSFKESLPQLIENEAIIAEIGEKLNGHDSAIQKATEITKAGALTKEKSQEIDSHLDPVLSVTAEVQLSIKNLQNLDPATRSKADKLHLKSEELRKKVENVCAKIKDKRNVFKSEENLEAAKELIKTCEESWSKCQTAEMPFLMGVEVLPKDENEVALKECSEAIAAATTASADARNLMKSSLAAANTYTKDLAASTTAGLAAQIKLLDAIDVKLSKYRKELGERKVLPIIAGASEAALDFQKKVTQTEKVAKLIMSSSLEDETMEKINEVVEQTKKALQEATAQSSSAKSVLRKTQIEANANDKHPALLQIQKSINEANEKLAKVRGSLTKAETLVKLKTNINNAEAKLKEAEDSVAKAKSKLPESGKKFSLETVGEFNEACNIANLHVRTVLGLTKVVPGFASAQTKAEIEKLAARGKALQEEIEQIKTSSKEQREEAQVSHFLEEAEGKAKAVEAACEKLEEAEGPFLVGAALTTSKNANEIISKCNEAATAVKSALSSFRLQSTAKSSEAKKEFSADAYKKMMEGFAAMTERTKKVSAKIASFEKESQARVCEVRMLEVGEKAAELSDCTKKTFDAVEPFTKEGADKMSEADAEAPLNTFLDLEKELRKKITELTTFLGPRLKEQKDNNDNLESIKKVQGQLKEVRDQLVEKKKHTAAHEKRALGKRLLAEVKESVAGLDAEVNKATEACAVLLEDGGNQFLVVSSVQTLVAAIEAAKKDSSLEDAFKAANKGKALSEKDFGRYVKELVEAGHDELEVLSDERRAAMFKRVASSSKGISGISRDDFLKLFNKTYNCVRQVSLTPDFEVEGSEALCKVEPNTQVELIGEAKNDEKGLSRSQCKVGDKEGWITIRQNKGQTFLAPHSPYKACCVSVDNAVNSGAAAVSKVAMLITAKVKEASAGDSAPLKEARDEMTKLKAESTNALKKIEDLRKKVAEAKRSISEKEIAEKNAHIEAKNQKEAAPFLDGPKAKMEALEPEGKALDDAAAPMTSLSNDDLKTFATPASLHAEVEKHFAALKEKSSALREAVSEQMKNAAAISPPTSGTRFAITSLKAMTNKMEALLAKARKTQATINTKCKGLVNAVLEPAAAAIRKIAADKGQSLEALFDSMKKEDRISEPDFCKLLQSVAEPKVSAELARLIVGQIRRGEESDGVSLEAFKGFVVLYYKVVRTIAWTDAKDVENCKTLRKADEDEVVEVLEGPVTIESNGMTRIRGRSTKKGDNTEGWITVSGSKGTPFLQKSTKPAA